MKIYTGSVCSYYECGEDSGDDVSLVAICDSPEKAHNAVMEKLYYHYNYDPDTNTYYGDYADEAWEEIWEYELNGLNPLGRMARDDNGNWFNEFEKIKCKKE